MSFLPEERSCSPFLTQGSSAAQELAVAAQPSSSYSETLLPALCLFEWAGHQRHDTEVHPLPVPSFEIQARRLICWICTPPHPLLPTSPPISTIDGSCLPESVRKSGVYLIMGDYNESCWRSIANEAQALLRLKFQRTKSIPIRNVTRHKIFYNILGRRD